MQSVAPEWFPRRMHHNRYNIFECALPESCGPTSGVEGNRTIVCGIIGISACGPVAADLYEGLIQLQHRGQDAAGIATFDGCFHVARGLGYVREAFTERSVRALKGSLGIAHTRYTTVGSATSAAKMQPFLTNAPLEWIIRNASRVLVIYCMSKGRISLFFQYLFYCIKNFLNCMQIPSNSNLSN